MFKKLSLYYHTLRYLKFIQIKYRLFYLLRKLWRNKTGFSYSFQLSKNPSTNDLALIDSIPIEGLYSKANTQFNFLNLPHSFHDNIDWNYSAYGKLWTYNLNYFEFLNQAELSKKDGLHLIQDFIKQSATHQDGFEPFPVSLRIIFWLRFIIRHQIKDSKIDSALFVQSKILQDNLEFHILGNHLLENAFALYFSAYYFNDSKLYDQARKLLIQELDEQILKDGAHFELSPMYHQIMLYRILDIINLTKNNPDIFSKNSMLEFLTAKANRMLAWLSNISFSKDRIPLFNDSSFGIAPNTSDLLNYAQRLKLEIPTIPLSDSGYRRYSGENYEMIVDVGPVGPDYIPGHAHCDALNFEIFARQKPWIVDTGVSTYEKNEQRQKERSTISHNTVSIPGYEQSEVWGGFRVGRRAKVRLIEDSPEAVGAEHDGYKQLGAIHQRRFHFNQKSIAIIDKLTSREKIEGSSILHFHPEVALKINQQTIETNLGKISVKNAKSIRQQTFDYAPKFNIRIPSQKVIITFVDHLEMTFSL